MRLPFALLLPLLGWVPALAQQGVFSEISGKVRNALSGDPVPQARVTLRATTGQVVAAALSSPDGSFSLPRIDPGRYHLAAERKGYVEARFGARSSSSAGSILAVDVGARLSGADLSMAPAAVLSGRILDENGEPLQNAEVYTLRRSREDGRLETILTDSTSTNDLGEYRLPNLSPARYWLAVRYRPDTPLVRPAASPEARQEFYVLTYYPGVPDVNAAAPLDVTPGAQMAGLDFAPARLPGGPVSGRIVKVGDGPCSRFNVTLAPRYVSGILNSRAAPSRENGTFEVPDIPTGSYTLLATCSDGIRNYSAARTVEVGNGGLQDLEVPVYPGVEISGRFVFRGNAAPPLEGLQFHLETQEPPRRSYLGRALPDGRFALKSVPPGLYRARASRLAEGIYVKSILSGGVNLAASGVNTSGGGSISDLEVVLAPGGTVEGAVTPDEKNPGAAGVLLVPAAQERAIAGRFMTAVTDQNGRFVFRGVAPGAYKLIAWPDLEDVAYMESKVLAAIEKSGTSISVREGETAGAQLPLQPPPER